LGNYLGQKQPSGNAECNDGDQFYITVLIKILIHEPLEVNSIDLQINGNSKFSPLLSITLK